MTSPARTLGIVCNGDFPVMEKTDLTHNFRDPKIDDDNKFLEISHPLIVLVGDLMTRPPLECRSQPSVSGR